ncbi:MAG: lamin tail domain-containing protein [Verrucomicrobiales bacterium]
MRTPLLGAALCLLSLSARADSVVVFNEIHYHPANTADAEWIELQNQLAVDIDLSGWKLSGGVNFSFPDGTILPADGYLTVASAGSTVPGALGPWSGRLDNDGERIELQNNNGRVMDEVEFEDDDDWPVAADGAGPTLARRAVNLATNDPRNWQASQQTGGTPGAENFPAFLPPVETMLLDSGSAWRFFAQGTAPDAAWNGAGYDDSGWAVGTAAFQLGAFNLPAPAASGTALPSGPVTYYFRRTFSFSGSPANVQLRLRLLIDDGASVYLGGVELARMNLPAGTLDYSTSAQTPRRGDPQWQEFLVPAGALANGSNLIAVEVHQGSVLPAYSAAVLASGPVAYWRLGESTSPAFDVADLSPSPELGPQNGLFAGLLAANISVPGPRPADTINSQPLTGFEATNGAPSFQGNASGGDDVVTFPDSGVLNFGAAKRFSFEVWVKGPPAQEEGAAIIAKGGGGGGEQFALDLVGGRYRFFSWDGGSPNTVVIASSTVAPNNTWQHLVGVFDQSQNLMRLYVNGVQAAAATPRPTLLSSTHEISIGARQNAGSAAYDLNFQGVVDEVSIYPRALTPAEITAHYNSAFAASSSGSDTSDALFAAELTTIETRPTPSRPALIFNEIAGTQTSGFALELMNPGSSSLALGGVVIARFSSGTRTNFVLPAQTLAAGGFLAVDAATLGFAPLSGDRLVLFSAEGVPFDGVVAEDSARARHPDGVGDWLRPATATFGAANAVTLHNEIAINEIMYHPAATAGGAGTQWIELFNRSAAPVDLSAWRLDGGIHFTFPSGTMLGGAGHLVVAENPGLLPGISALGPWNGRLSRHRDRVTLKDPAGNPADEAVYFDGAPWPATPDGGGSSLERRDARADPQAAANWAASDETADAPWQTFTWRGRASPGVAGEPTQWREIDLCLLDGPGEFLLDDVSVVDINNSMQLIQNGDFSGEDPHWRATGTHRHTRIDDEPGNSGNLVLRVIATGPGEYQGNQVESTFVGNTALVDALGRDYEISMRVRWLSGGRKFNVRLYFNRLARTFDLAVPPAGGTPGAPNSRAVANSGPTYRGLVHSPPVPAVGQAVTVNVEAADPDGLGALELKYAVGANAFQTLPMASTDGRHFSAIIPGQPAASLVRFHVSGADSLGVQSLFPPGGVDSRAMFPVQDGAAAAGPPHKFRLVMTAVDAAFLHANVNTLSNAFLGATIIADEREIYYDCGVRLKGSFVGRNVPRVGFTIVFPGDQPFRGVHERLAVDRSQHVAIAQGEIIAKHVASRAGGIPNVYDDLARFIHVLPGYNSTCQLRMSAFDNDYLDAQFPNGGDGTMYEYEVIRYSSTTSNGTPEGIKLPGQGYVNLDLADRGNEREAYRWNYLLTNQRERDDLAPAVALGKMFSLSGTAFDTASKAQLDVEEWLRTMAYQVLVGPADCIYTGANIHNIRLYVRPQDAKTLYMPWDWDSVFQIATSASLFGGGNVSKVVTVTPHNRRRYLCHVHDIIQSAYNTGYMSRWTQHYGQVAGEDYTGILNYIGARAAYALTQLPTTTLFTAVAGAVSANGAVTVTGNAKIHVSIIEVNGLNYTPLWTSNTAWSITVPLAQGPNTLNIRGLDKRGQPVAAASATLEVNNPNEPGWPGIRINEWLAANSILLDPADGDSDDFFELFNPGDQPVDLSGWKVSDDPINPSLYAFPSGTSIPARGFLLIWADEEAAQNAPGGALHATFKLDDEGEILRLSAPDGREIDVVTFGQQEQDQSEGRYADGNAEIAALTLPTPGSANILTRLLSVQTNAGSIEVAFTTTPGRQYRIEGSTDLLTWAPLTTDQTASGGILTLIAPATPQRQFLRIAVAP